MTYSQFLLLPLLATLVGCAHTVYLPGSLNQAPKVTGRLLGGRAGIQAYSQVKVDVVKSPTATPPDRSQFDVGTSSMFGLDTDVSIGLLEHLDLYFTSGLGLRWMVLGDPNTVGWKSTLFVGGLASGTKYWTDYNSGAVRAETVLKYSEYGFSIGKQIDSSNLFYASLGNQSGTGETSVVQGTNTYEYKDNYTHTVASLGVLTGYPWYFNAEIAHTFSNWENTKGDLTTWAVGTGYAW
jgi:hypothetical protein